MTLNIFVQGTKAKATEVNTNFALTSKYLIEATDSGVSDYEGTTTSFVLVRTFAITGLETTDIIDELWVDGLLSEDATGTNAEVAIGLDDGTDSYIAKLDTSNLNNDLTITTGDVTQKLQMFQTSSLTPVEFKKMMKFPLGLVTGSTTWNIKIYLRHETAAGDKAILTKGFSVGMTLYKELQTDGSVAQS